MVANLALPSANKIHMRATSELLPGTKDWLYEFAISVLVTEDVAPPQVHHV